MVGHLHPQAAKQEQWEERNKLGSRSFLLYIHDLYKLTRISHVGNQFRALEEDEIMFLDSVRERQLEEERRRKEEDGVELAGFRE